MVIDKGGILHSESKSSASIVITPVLFLNIFVFADAFTTQTCRLRPI